jgi:hypothetical protein
MVVLAKNQQPSALALEAAQAARLVGTVGDIATQLPLAIAELIASDGLSQMSVAASAVTDGLGIKKVLHAIGVANA